MSSIHHLNFHKIIPSLKWICIRALSSNQLSASSFHFIQIFRTKFSKSSVKSNDYLKWSTLDSVIWNIHSLACMNTYIYSSCEENWVESYNFSNFWFDVILYRISSFEIIRCAMHTSNATHIVDVNGWTEGVGEKRLKSIPGESNCLQLVFHFIAIYLFFHWNAYGCAVSGTVSRGPYHRHD